MNNLKLSLLKKWELDSELSFVHGSVLLPDGTATRYPGSPSKSHRTAPALLRCLLGMFEAQDDR